VGFTWVNDMWGQWYIYPTLWFQRPQANPGKAHLAFLDHLTNVNISKSITRFHKGTSITSSQMHQKKFRTTHLGSSMQTTGITWLGCYNYSFITGLFSLAFGLCSLGFCSSIFLTHKVQRVNGAWLRSEFTRLNRKFNYNEIGFRKLFEGSVNIDRVMN
jgi:hypothetical protein